MDNVTHTLIGLVAGDAIHHASHRNQMPHIERRRFFLLASVLGSNVPDLDFIFSRALPAPLGYLLYHRGHTHTFFAVVPQTILVIVALFFLRRLIFSKLLTKRDWALGGLTVAAGVATHIFADSWNSYGVHPFFPWNNNWYFGDFIFIIEPILWAALMPWVLVELSRPLRVLLSLIVASILLYGYSLGFLDFRLIMLWLAVVVFLASTMVIFKPSTRSWISMVVTMIVLSGFKLQSINAKSLAIEDHLSRGRPKPVDVSSSPEPANPYCWNVMVATIEKESFLIRSALVSLKPEIAFLTCGRRVPTRSTPEQVLWHQERSTRLSVFDHFKADCFLNAWLRFGRFPVITGDNIEDVRFSRGGSNFTQMKLMSSRECPESVPQWKHPRAELIK